MRIRTLVCGSQRKYRMPTLQLPSPPLSRLLPLGDWEGGGGGGSRSALSARAISCSPPCTPGRLRQADELFVVMRGGLPLPRATFDGVFPGLFVCWSPLPAASDVSAPFLHVRCVLPLAALLPLFLHPCTALPPIPPPPVTPAPTFVLCHRILSWPLPRMRTTLPAKLALAHMCTM
ncbi:hypothetical protein Q4I32_000421 [Leishmania shawi]|uniref:Uncharacterized protein n=1 Tax=Leishmania shawi TaxID=5680 RepID=A0AAW3CBQ8_9TRYP